MHLRLWMLLALLTLSGCNLGQGNTPTLPTPTSQGTTRPRVDIVSPSNGAELRINENVRIEVSASDSVGVTRIQLLINDEIVRTIDSDDPRGEPLLTEVFNYTPRNTGSLKIASVAQRGVVDSEPSIIRVNVVSGLTPTPTPTATNIVPGDGVCRALTTAILNLRSQPTTQNDNVIMLLPANTLAPIVARLGDNSWWKINISGVVGWVSASYTNISGNCLNVPIEPPPVLITPTWTRTPTPTFTPTPTLTWTPVPGRPDLTVSSIGGSNILRLPAGETSITGSFTVVVTNTGNGPTSGQFSSSLVVGGTEYDLGVVSGLGPGESITLVQDLTFDGTGVYNLLAIVDSNNQISETNESNNQRSLEVAVVNAS